MAREVLDRFGCYPWPGNIRELRTAVEHGVVMAKGSRVELSDLPPGIREMRESRKQGSSIRSARLEDLEKEAILAALEGADQNITVAAKQLGISRRTLHRKLAEFRKGHRKKT